MAEQRKSTELAAFLAGASDDERAEALHAYAKGSTEEVTADTQAARQALQEGTPADVIALAGIDIKARARVAAERFKSEKPEPSDAA